MDWTTQIYRYNSQKLREVTIVNISMCRCCEFVTHAMIKIWCIYAAHPFDCHYRATLKNRSGLGTRLKLVVSLIVSYMASLECNPPYCLDEHSYIFKDILGYKWVSAWRYCNQLQKKWSEEYSRDEDLVKQMERWKESKSLHLVWVSDKFGKALPSGISEKKTYVLLGNSYAELCSDPHFDGDSLKRKLECEPESDQHLPQVPVEHSITSACNAEEDRGSELQLKQHLRALVFLERAAEDGITLSENLIKWSHRYLMEGLHTNDGLRINSGGYRTRPVSDGNHHLYIHHEAIPSAMSELISKHHSMQGHDPFERASVLLVEFLTIHPFEDGNGRVSRLLWCYSLMLDGLPFPLTPFPGIKTAYKNHISCVEKDRNRLSSHPSASCANTTSFTIVSVTKVWQNFISNLRQESPDKHKDIAKWLNENNITLDPISSLEV